MSRFLFRAGADQRQILEVDTWVAKWVTPRDLSRRNVDEARVTMTSRWTSRPCRHTFRLFHEKLN